MNAKRCSYALVTGIVLAFGVRAQAAPTLLTGCVSITASGSYRLANNVTASGTCLFVGASNVAIDMDGFTIAGSGTGYGIWSADVVEGFTVRNGTIKGFDTGIAVLGNNMFVERMTIIRNVTAGFWNGFENLMFKDNIVSGNGVGLRVGQGSAVIGNIVTFNTDDGILANANGAASTGTFVNNTVVANAGAGLRLVCPSTVTGNTATSNAGGNIVLSGSGCSRRLRAHNAAP